MNLRLARVAVAFAITATVLFECAWEGRARAGDEPLHVALIWHNHQPLYRDPATGECMLPWVRMHAVKDYYDMASTLLGYPRVHATFNLVPSLMAQLDGYASGAKDVWQIVSEKPAAELTDAERDFVLRRFFDANRDRIIKKHPRYWELLQKRGESVSDESIARAREAFAEQDFRDLQVWFNLAWLDPDFIAEDPELAALVAKGRGFSEADKRVVLAKHMEIVRDVLPLYRAMQDSGQIEVTTSPFYHPIMPLLFDTRLALVASPELRLPSQGFAHPEDIEAQLAMAVDSYEERFGRGPRGLWPSEQAVGQDIVGLVADAGFEWMVSSEGVLARSLGMSLRDGSGNVARPDLLYKPYLVRAGDRSVAVLFRDIALSDKIGFSYSGMDGADAARDLLGYLRDVKKALAGAPGPHIVTIALDGENCWEYYENDGKEFLHSLYAALDSDPDFRAVTVGEYLQAHPPQDAIPALHTGSWISDNLETWIGEEEENRAWEYLARAREALAASTAESAAAAWDELYAAEGSDWFWWYGDDQDSANDRGFDELFRAHLRNAYRLAGLAPPGYLYMPIVPKDAASPNVAMTDFVTPTLDGQVEPREWNAAALYFKDDDGKAPIPVPASGSREGRGSGEMLLRALWVGVDADNLWVRIDVRGGVDSLFGEDAAIAVYVSDPRRVEANSVPRWSGAGPSATDLGFPLATEVLVDFRRLDSAGAGLAMVSTANGDETWTHAGAVTAAGVGRTLEIRLPFDEIGLEPGDAVNLAVVASRRGENVDAMPAGGPARVVVPEVIAGSTVFRCDDPKGDDYGPGTYTYPLNAVFKPGVFDMVSFQVLEVEDDVVFQVGLAGEIANPWNSPVGISLQTIDVYIDTDRAPGSGRTEALGGRRVAFEPECAWELAIWVEGWNQRIFRSDGREAETAIRVSQDPVNRVISIFVPKSAIGEPDPSWGYQVFVLSQEGYPAPGNLRVREVLATAQEWRLGGGLDSEIDPNVIDMLAPPGTTQERILGSYRVEDGRIAQAPMVYGIDQVADE